MEACRGRDVEIYMIQMRHKYRGKREVEKLILKHAKKKKKGWNIHHKRFHWRV